MSSFNSISNNSSNPAILVQLPDSSTKVIIKEEDSATVENAEENTSQININVTNTTTGALGGHSTGLRVSFGGGRRGDLNLFRAPSPISSEQQLYLALPQAHSGRSCTGSISDQLSNGGDAVNYPDEKMLIKSLELLADALGFKKSFSTNDIIGIGFDKKGPNDIHHNPTHASLQRSQSDMRLSDVAPLARIEASSRSLSTWVAVGDTSATTQLPSPQVVRPFSKIYPCIRNYHLFIHYCVLVYAIYFVGTNEHNYTKLYSCGSCPVSQ